MGITVNFTLCYLPIYYFHTDIIYSFVTTNKIYNMKYTIIIIRYKKNKVRSSNNLYIY